MQTKMKIRFIETGVFFLKNNSKVTSISAKLLNKSNNSNINFSKSVKFAQFFKIEVINQCRKRSRLEINLDLKVCNHFGQPH